MGLLTSKTSLVYIVPYSNEKILNKWFFRSPTNDNQVKTIQIPKESCAPIELNKILEDYDDNNWLVFCDQDVRLLENLAPLLDGKKKDTLYGVTGAVIKKPQNEIVIIDGRTGYPMIDNKKMDSVGQGCMIIHSSALKKYNCKFDEHFVDLYMIDFSLQCKQNGMKIASISLPSIFNEKVINIEKIENYKKILRQKYADLLPIGLWSGILSHDEFDDLKNYVSIRDNWINTLIKEKKLLQAKLRRHEKIVQDASEKTSFTNLQGKKSSEFKILAEHYKELEKKLVWIFGTPRSGSTWLASEILRHKGIRILDEPAIGIHLGAFFDNPQIHWNLFNVNYSTNFTRIIDRDRDNLFFSKKYEPVWKDSLRSLILDRISAQFGLAGYDNIVIKAPNESHAADIIMKCLPNSKMVLLVRDGRDVIDSRQGKFHNPRLGKATIETPQERQFRISHFALMWNHHTTIAKKAFDLHSPQLRLFVKYEDLRLGPIEQIKRIYKFLGFELSESEIKKISSETSFENVPADQKGEDKNKRKARPEGYKEYFTYDEIRLLNKIMKENLIKFGYMTK